MTVEHAKAAPNDDVRDWLCLRVVLSRTPMSQPTPEQLDESLASVAAFLSANERKNTARRAKNTPNGGYMPHPRSGRMVPYETWKSAEIERIMEKDE